MSDLYKLGWMPEGQNEERYAYPNIWTRETTTGPDRLVIAPRSQYVDLLQTLASCLSEPFLLLYVLVVPRGEGEPGRHQSKYSFTGSQLHAFLSEYSQFLEKDGRHNLWIRSASDDGMLVYDRHNVIYAYGPLERFVVALNSTDLVQSDEIRLQFRSPHVHHYHPEFDSDQQRMLTNEEWSISPLRPGDENPD